MGLTKRMQSEEFEELAEQYRAKKSLISFSGKIKMVGSSSMMLVLPSFSKLEGYNPGMKVKVNVWKE